MITSEVFDGLIAFSLFTKDYKLRGKQLSPFIYFGIVFTWMCFILALPLMLFIDLSWWIIKLSIKYYEKKEFIGKKRYKKK